MVGLKTEITDSALEAAILEGYYIKKYRPKYNVQWRDDKSWNYIGITKDNFPKIRTIREHELTADKKKEFKYLFDRTLTQYQGSSAPAAKIFIFSTYEPDAKRPCFYYQLGQCLGFVSEIFPPKIMLLK